MQVIIQGIPERWGSIKKIKQRLQSEGFDPIIHLDKKRICTLVAFSDMLHDYPIEDYRLHFQDDVFLSRDFKERLEEVFKDMIENNYDFVGLFAPKRKAIDEANLKGEKYVVEKSPWIQGCLFSPKALKDMKEHTSTIDLKINRADDHFIGECVKKYNWKSVCVTESLVQHNIAIRSSLGHPNSELRTSKYFKK